MREVFALPIKHHLRLLIVPIFVLLTGGCSAVNLEKEAEEANYPRTFYDTLDLDTPESTLQTFVDFYRREDFYTVFLILSPKTQARWYQEFGTIHHLDRHLYGLPFHHLFKAESAEEIADILADTPIYHAVPLMKEWIIYPGSAEFQFFEHRNTAYYFDFLMLSAKQHSALYIDLDGEVIIQEMRASEHARYGPITDVVTSIDGIEGQVLFRMVQAPSGRWRVLQVILPGGNEDMLPWAVPIFYDPGRLQTLSARGLYPLALERAQQWRPDAYLDSIRVEVRQEDDPTEQLEITFGFESHSDDYQSISTSFYEDVDEPEVKTFDHSKSIYVPTPIESEDWPVDSVDALAIAQDNGGIEFLTRHDPDTTNVILRFGYPYPPRPGARLLWEVSYYDSSLGSLEITIDAETGEVVEVK